MLNLMLYDVLSYVVNILTGIIFIQAILSWLLVFNVIQLRSPGVRSIWDGLCLILEPIYRPIRRVLPEFGTLDLSPLVALFILQVVFGRWILPLLLQAANYQ